MDDRSIVSVQIGRPPRSPVDVRSRCHLGLPVVIAVPPHLDDGTPFPTRYWVTCPLAVLRISRIESEGGVAEAEAVLEADPELWKRHEAATEQYVADREAAIAAEAPPPRPSGGVGGARAGVKCLHAHYAHHRAGHDNPIGEITAERVEPLNCRMACTVPAGDAAVHNPAWREPPR